MVLQRVRVHPRGLSWRTKSKVFFLRKQYLTLKWTDIAKKATNLNGEHPYWKVCRDAYNDLRHPRRRLPDNYNRRGRKPKLTQTLRKWMVARLRKLRLDTDVSSTDLQAELAKGTGVEVEESTVSRAWVILSIQSTIHTVAVPHYDSAGCNPIGNLSHLQHQP